ncbi:methylenetetrahydrofolate reductase [Thermosulfuriphilus ammonigenes]|uniref:Methylenetetrahydrofolate reductase n=1 Tax=Thermosulfuriphilus ammonigenes TaxID=1936021 RepID=A0A6G7PWD7_9BACT|nr:methylenetetrahydrofolate reductase C-terminal domain-containing protein [Thermosulfuriphilus ammonigenes]MBA2847979.1 methylenetetrahydrofolate reductase (NADPH) [Thermosulfuriphilus ammonigenes]QIJ71831.1 methylenetetrahydrofolate reductase [Thermosulfuriphilus ammonigenes]
MEKVREALARKEFIFTFELVPGRGSRGKAYDQLVAFAEAAARGGRLHALSITENAGGHPALAPEVLGREIKALGLETIIHFSCKDRNRNQMESHLFAWDREGFHTILVMTGDFPRVGFGGQAKPVFDLDSVQTLALISRLNQGYVIRNGQRLPPTSFFKGCVVSPFKRLEAEVMTQYFKLERKISAGADFVITQIGFDARKFDELLRYLRLRNLEIPVIGGVFVLDLPLARIMHRGRIPGCRVTDELLAKIEAESEAPDGGLSARLLRAAKQVALLKGLGYAGAHICGPNLTYEQVEFIVEKALELTDNWLEFVPEFTFAPEGTFYLFQKDPRTGLNTDDLTPRAPASSSPWHYVINRLIHDNFFLPDGPLFSFTRRLFLSLADSPLAGMLDSLEYFVKKILFDCRSCGDCTLGELAFLCPQSKCAKYLLNGPCGGSYDGWCEVFPGKRRCLYVQAYERLKAQGEEESLARGMVPPRDWALNGTSSWINYFSGRDHHRLGDKK